jgi:hypothetical protein
MFNNRSRVEYRFLIYAKQSSDDTYLEPLIIPHFDSYIKARATLIIATIITLTR